MFFLLSFLHTKVTAETDSADVYRSRLSCLRVLKTDGPSLRRESLKAGNEQCHAEASRPGLNSPWRQLKAQRAP